MNLPKLLFYNVLEDKKLVHVLRDDILGRYFGMILQYFGMILQYFGMKIKLTYKLLIGPKQGFFSSVKIHT